MSEYPTDDPRSTTIEEHHAALLSLHVLASEPGRDDPGLVPGLRRAPTGHALRTLARMPLEEVPVSARVGVLGDLARAGFPDLESAGEQYRELAASVAEVRSGVEPGQLLDDLKLATSEGVPFSTLSSGKALKHHEAAFVGQDVCSARTVRTDGLEATWIFSEIETDAPFATVAEWVDPRNWPARGPMLFKGMDLVGGDRPVSLPPPGDVHWHGIFREEVQLVRRVRTLLHCDYWQDGRRAAGMTYDLALSLDDEIDVDRGFLLVNDLGPVRRVKALKIVGFTKDIWDGVARLVCPFWTDWVRAAVEGGTSSGPVTPSTSEEGPAGDGARSSWLGPAGEWIDYLGESARDYLGLLDEMGMRCLDPDARRADLARDQQRLFSRVAQDWAQAWMSGMEVMEQVAREGGGARVAPPRRSGTGAASSGRASRTGASGTTSSGAATSGAATSGTAGSGGADDGAVRVEGTTVPVEGLAPGDLPSVSDLVSIEAGGAVIPASAVSTTVVPLGDQRYAVRLQAPVADVAAGLYVGQLTPRGAAPVPVQLYVSRSTDG